MNAPFLTRRLTVEEFLAWIEARAAALASDEPKWELFDGVPEMQQSQRKVQARVKYLLMKQLEEAIGSAQVPYEADVGGLSVRIGPRTLLVPDVVVYPLGKVADDDLIAIEPIIVVEVLSLSSTDRDLVTKAGAYAKVASIEHYLVVDPDARPVRHFRRSGQELIASSDAVGQGVLRLDPPGLELAVGACFPV
jgi:Uma2 family endonuclease